MQIVLILCLVSKLVNIRRAVSILVAIVNSLHNLQCLPVHKTIIQLQYSTITYKLYNAYIM